MLQISKLCERPVARIFKIRIMTVGKCNRITGGKNSNVMFSLSFFECFRHVTLIGVYVSFSS